MADPVSNIFQTTLLVLYFIAPAKTVHLPGTLEAKEAFEKTQLWTLQSTSQISTENPDMCVVNGLLLLQKFAAVSTTTVKLYCLCSQQAIKNFKVCDEARRNNAFALQRDKLATPPASIIEIGPRTKMPDFSGAPQQ